MSALTTRLSLYKPGGGSTGTITPDETADIDKLNGNFDLIDAAVGATICTSGTRPGSPYDGQVIFETDTGRVRVWRQAITTWAGLTIYDTVGRGTRTIYYAADLDGLAGIIDEQEGDLCHIDEGDFWMGSIDGSVWVQISPARFATTGARDTAFAKASAAYLVQGATVRRTDANWLEEYSAVYATPGNLNGRDSAGWYVTAVDTERNRTAFYSASAVASGTALGTMVFKRRSYAYRVVFQVSGGVGFAGGTVTCNVAVAATTGGTLTINNTDTVQANAGQFTGYSKIVTLDVASGAGTDVTVSFTTSSSGTCHWRIEVGANIYVPGEYS